MPTYDYRCEACGHAFEEFQSMSAKHLKKCPECGKNKLVRLIGIGAGVIFKGSGFYETDYRSSSYNEAAKADKESSTPSEAKADNKTDSKADTKTDTKTDGKSEATKSDSSKPETKSETKPDSSSSAGAGDKGKSSAPKSDKAAKASSDGPTKKSAKGN